MDEVKLYQAQVQRYHQPGVKHHETENHDVVYACKGDALVMALCRKWFLDSIWRSSFMIERLAHTLEN
jgi:hypothetical protein